VLRIGERLLRTMGALAMFMGTTKIVITHSDFQPKRRGRRVILFLGVTLMPIGGACRCLASVIYN